MRDIARWAYRLLMPREAKNTLRLYLLLDERDKLPEPITDYATQQVLVLAPHMDDEVIGCGGVVRKHATAGARVTVVFLTDGRKGDPNVGALAGLGREKIAEAEMHLVRRRKEESMRAAEILGVAETVFLDGPDLDLRPDPAMIERVAALVAQRRPRIIYVPSVLEIHPDHWAANRILYRVLTGSPGLQTKEVILREYEAWTPLLPNRVADIDDVFDVKVRALQCFESQNSHVDYVRATSGLNSYRSIYQGRGRGHAEAFFETTPRQFIELHEQFEQRR